MTQKGPKASPLQTRREEEKEERRQQILDAAERVIRKQGWDATNFGEVAKAARLSRSLVYFYFPDRNALFHAVCDRGIQILARSLQRALAEQKKGVDQLIAIGRAYRDFSEAQPLYFDLLSVFHAGGFAHPADAACQPEEAAHDHGRECLGLVAQAVANGLADGSVRKSVGDPQVTAVATWAFTHGLIQMTSHRRSKLEEHFGISEEQTLEHGFALLRGMVSAKVK